MGERQREASIEKWIAATQYPGEPSEDIDARVNLIGDFLKHIDKGPDELVAYCFLKKKDTGDRFVSTQRRKSINEQIESFVAAQGWADKQQVINGNRIRSFLTHNGAPMGNKVWSGG